MKIYFQVRKLAPIAVVGGSLIFAPACGDDDNAEPSKPPTLVDDAGATNDGKDSDTRSTASPGDAGENTSSGDTGENTAGDASTNTDDVVETSPDSGGVNTLEPTLDGGTDTTEGPQGCVENDEACFSCPSTPEQFLTQCSESECEPFDNTRLGRFVPGEPLPEL